MSATSGMLTLPSASKRLRLPAVSWTLPLIVLEVRLPRDDVQGAAAGVLAEQGSLRAAQDFHALDIHRVQVVALHAPEEHAIDVDSDRRVVGRANVGLADAANVDHRRAAPRGAAFAEQQVGDGLPDVGEAFYRALREILRADRGHRNRDALQGLRRAARRDDDLLQLTRDLRSCVGCGRRRTRDRSLQHHDGHDVSTHVFPLPICRRRPRHVDVVARVCRQEILCPLLFE